MKIELGKTYKTRDGRKARVVCVDRLTIEEERPVISLVEDDDGDEFISCHCMNGLRRTDGGDHYNDLVSEWVEPLTAWGVVGQVGTLHVVSSRLSAASCAEAIGGRVVKLVEVSE